MKLSEWIAKNLWAILAILGGAAQGYNIGTGRMEAMAHEISALNGQLKARGTFLDAAQDRIEFMCNRDKDCRARFPPMQSPE